MLQKVAQIPQAANLYKQTGASWSIYMLTLFQLCLSTIRDHRLTTANIQEIIEEHSRWAFTGLYKLYKAASLITG